MASKDLINIAMQLAKQLGANTNKFMGTRTNISFLGKGPQDDLLFQQDINTEALSVLPLSKILPQIESSMGYLTGGKLNDLQATKLVSNLHKMKEFHFPSQIPNITDMGTGTRNLTQEGLGALRATGDDLPPPGSRGGPDDIAAPVQSAEETIKNLERQDPELAVQFKNIFSNRAELPAKRATAREFLVEALKEDDTFATKLSSVVDAEDVKYITEGGGGIAGDPLVLVEKYFGPRISEMIPPGASNEEIILFTRRVMNNVEDAAGFKPDNPRFDRFTARFVDEVQDFAKGGLAKILEV